jgi:hypothetical protein
LKKPDDAGEVVDKSHEKSNLGRRGPELSRRERIFLAVVNVLVIGILISDLWYFLGLVIVTDLRLLAISNICVMILAYFSYVMKRRIRRRIIRAEQEAEETHLTDEHP